MTTVDPNQFSRDAWNANAEVWDARMGDDGNDFFNVLCWGPTVSLLDASSTGQKSTIPPLPYGHNVSTTPLMGQHILDIACGNGLTSRRLAALGAKVIAFDFAENLIEKAIARENPNSHIEYRIIDATNEGQLISLGEGQFDSALSNMALFDMA